MSRRIWRWGLLGTALIAAGAMAGFVTDLREVGSRLADVSLGSFVAALLFVLLNYALRWVRWHWYVRDRGVPLSTRDSVLAFCAGLAFSVTPGKAGEAMKGVIVREMSGTPALPVVSIVIAERVCDLIAMVLLALLAAWWMDVGGAVAGPACVVVVAGVVLLSIPAFNHGVIGLIARARKLRALARHLESIYVSLRPLLRPRALTFATLLSVPGWWTECVAFYIIAGGTPGVALTLGMATLIYTTTSLAGALSFLPGGLAVTEVTMAAFLTQTATHDEAAAIVVTVLVRLATLWFGVTIGGLALLLWRLRARATLAKRAP